MTPILSLTRTLIARPSSRKCISICVRTFSVSSPKRKEKLVVLGSGWGGYEVLRGVDKGRWDVTIISPNTYFNFTPLLASCAVGTLEFRCAVEPVRNFAPQVAVHQARCEHIDFDQKVITCEPSTPLPSRFERQQNIETADTPIRPQPSSQFRIPYDKLVIAVGAYSQTFGIPGVKEHAYFLKDVADARAIRHRILECFEEASQPIVSDEERKKILNFCIVGGGPTGVEFAAELHDLITSDIQKRYPVLSRFARITLYDVATTILNNFDKHLSEYAEKKFARDGINMKLGHHVQEVKSGRLIIKEQGEVPFGLLVWSTGLAPNGLIESISTMAKDEKSGRLSVNDHLNVIRGSDKSVVPDVWAIGDAAQIQGNPLPATAQVASQQAKYLAKKLNRIRRDKPSPESFEFHSKGNLAYLGDWKAIYGRPGAGPSSGTASKSIESGRLAWLLWRSAYFTMTLSVRNKITVPYYWFLNWIFGRDLSRF